MQLAEGNERTRRTPSDLYKNVLCFFSDHKLLGGSPRTTMSYTIDKGRPSRTIIELPARVPLLITTGANSQETLFRTLRDNLQHSTLCRVEEELKSSLISLMETAPVAPPHQERRKQEDTQKSQFHACFHSGDRDS